MNDLIQTNRSNWGETLSFQSAPTLVTQRTKRAPRRLLWFALGLAVGLAPVLIG